jgi:hypothetical protein
MITAFLDHLETECHNPRTRNLRLTAIRTLFTYASLRHPEHAALIQRVLANLAKRFDNSSSRSAPQSGSTPSSPIPTAPGGKAAATAYYCYSLRKPAFASP